MAAKEKTKPGNNGYDPDKLTAYLEACEAEDKKIATIMSVAMTDCKAPNKKRKELLNDAKADGFPKMEMKALLKVRDFDRKANAIRDDMDAENQNEFDKLCQAIGGLIETPLGQAAAHNVQTQEQAATH